MSRAAQPGDQGPCPTCGQEMREKVYMNKDVFGTTQACSGRYWHMLHEHGIFEDYAPPSSPADRLERPRD